MTIASLVGAVVSGYVDAKVLEGVFAAMAIVAAVVMIARPAEADGTTPHNVRAAGLDRPRAVAIGAGVGVLSGAVGVGGAFLLVPLMTHELRAPLRVAIGSSLAIVAFSSASGLVGKVATGQVDWGLAAALVAGAVPGAIVGARLSHRAPVRILSRALAVVIVLTAIRMSLDVLGS